MIIILAATGCDKRDTAAVSEKSRTQSLFPASEAKSWYDRGAGTKNINEKYSGNLHFIPLWNEAIETEDENYYVVECPLQFDKRPGFQVEKQGRSAAPETNGDTKLLVLKDKKNGNLSLVIMNVTAFNDGLDKNWHYRNPGKNFSGIIFFSDRKDNFIMGWEYKEGKIIARGRLTANIESGKVAPPEEECATYTVTTYERTCYYYDQPEYNYCTEWMYTGTSSVTFCGTNTSGGGGVVYITNEVDACTKCENDFENQYLNSQVVADNVSFEVITIDEFRKYNNPRWRILKNLTWSLYSQEIGIVRLVDIATNKWVWESLSHHSIYFVGTSYGGDISYDQGFGTPSFVPGTENVLSAGMSVAFRVTYYPGCKDCPVKDIIKPVTIPYISNGIFSAKPTN